MPQKRMMTSALWSDLDFISLTFGQRLWWLALISNADDQGRLQGHPLILRSLCFPGDNPAPETVCDDLAAIAHVKFITQYEVDGKAYIQIRKWWEYQCLQWAYPSQYPAPPGWKDRLRYSRNRKVVTYNWPNTADTIEPEAQPVVSAPLDDRPPRPLPGRQGSALPGTPDYDDGGDDDSVDGDDENRPARKAAPPIAPDPAPEKPKRSEAKARAEQRERETIAAIQPWVDAYLKGRNINPATILDADMRKIRHELMPLLQLARSPTPAEFLACTRWKASNPKWMPFTPGHGANQVLQDFGDWLGKDKPETWAGGNGQARASPGRRRVSEYTEEEMRAGQEADRGRVWQPAPD